MESQVIACYFIDSLIVADGTRGSKLRRLITSTFAKESIEQDMKSLFLPCRSFQYFFYLMLMLAISAGLFDASALQRNQRGRSAPQPTSAPAPTPLSLQYNLSFPQPHTHLYEVTFEISNISTPQIDLQMPTWTPGSYLQREFARHVQDFSVSDVSGQNLKWEKIDKATWRIENNHARSIKVSYRVYANDLSVRTSHLDASHAYFNGASVFMYVKGALDQPLKLKINAPQGWQVTTPLGLQPDANGNYSAPNYDILVDSPTEIGTHKLIEFIALGKPHRIAIYGAGNYDEAKLKEDFTKIVEQGAAIFGGLPYDHYTFIVQLQPGLTNSGLEHLNSTTCQAPPNTFRPQSSYAKFLDLIAHEYFHLWNVKRIRPAALGPFDYQQENYTSVLWFSEGVTDYYAQVLLRRAGLISPVAFLENKATEMLSYETTPGHREQSPAEASFDSWIKYYRPDENSVNTSFSYYTSGALLGWMLDFEVRSRTNNAKTLDDVMRYLYENYALKGRGFPESDLRTAFETVAGGEMSEFFNRYVYGKEKFPFDEYLGMAGLKRTPVYLPSPYDDLSKPPQPRGSLGIRTKLSGDRVIVSNVLDGTPAYTAGINANDEIVALNGEKVDASNLNERLSRLQPNQAVSIVVFRRDKLMTFELTTERQAPDRYTINSNPSEDTREVLILRQAWLQEAKK